MIEPDTDDQCADGIQQVIQIKEFSCRERQNNQAQQTDHHLPFRQCVINIVKCIHVLTAELHRKCNCQHLSCCLRRTECIAEMQDSCRNILVSSVIDSIKYKCCCNEYSKLEKDQIRRPVIKELQREDHQGRCCKQHCTHRIHHQTECAPRHDQTILLRILSVIPSGQPRQRRRKHKDQRHQSKRKLFSKRQTVMILRREMIPFHAGILIGHAQHIG